MGDRRINPLSTTFQLEASILPCPNPEPPPPPYTHTMSWEDPSTSPRGRLKAGANTVASKIGVS